MDPDMEHHYRDLLYQWKHDEDNIKDELKKLDTEVKEIGTNIKEFGRGIKELGTDIEEIGINIKECDTGIREVGTDVKEIGTDVKRLSKKLDDLMASNVTPANGAGKCVGIEQLLIELQLTTTFLQSGYLVLADSCDSCFKLFTTTASFPQLFPGFVR